MWMEVHQNTIGDLESRREQRWLSQLKLWCSVMPFANWKQVPNRSTHTHTHRPLNAAFHTCSISIQSHTLTHGSTRIQTRGVGGRGGRMRRGVRGRCYKMGKKLRGLCSQGEGGLSGRMYWAGEGWSWRYAFIIHFQPVCVFVHEVQRVCLGWHALVREVCGCNYASVSSCRLLHIQETCGCGV